MSSKRGGLFDQLLSLGEGEGEGEGEGSKLEAASSLAFLSLFPSLLSATNWLGNSSPTFTADLSLNCHFITYKSASHPTSSTPTTATINRANTPAIPISTIETMNPAAATTSDAASGIAHASTATFDAAVDTTGSAAPLHADASFKATQDAQENTVSCFACNRPGTQRCSACQNARYCSSECQKKDWVLHKLLCQSFVDLPARPSPSHYRGILFPDNEAKPRFIWVEQTGAKHWGFDREGHLGGGNTDKLDFNHYGPLKREFGHTISVWYRERFFFDGSPANQSLAKPLGPLLTYAWRGRLLALAYRLNGLTDEDGEEEGNMIDLDTASIGPVVSFLRWFQGARRLGYAWV
jgi:hypothetical protein